MSVGLFVDVGGGSRCAGISNGNVLFRGERPCKCLMRILVLDRFLYSSYLCAVMAGSDFFRWHTDLQHREEKLVFSPRV